MSSLKKKSVYFILVLLGFTVIWSINSKLMDIKNENEEIKLSHRAKLIELRMEKVLTSKINAPRYLKAFRVAHPRITSAEFQEVASNIMEINPSIKALQLADADTRVTFVYPEEGNEITIKQPMLLIEDSLRGSYVKKAIEEKQMTIQPPFRLRQGEMGIVARNPIFVADSLAGLSIAVLDVDMILNEVFSVEELSDYKLWIEDSEGNVFYDHLEDEEQFVERTVNFADAQWQIKVAEKESRDYTSLMTSILIVGFGGGFILLLLLLVYILNNKAEFLQTEKERQLNAISKNLRTGFIYQVVYKKNKREFTFVSDTVENIHGVKPNELLHNPEILYKYIHPEDIDRLNKQENEALTDLAPISIEFRAKDYKGVYRWFLVNSFPRVLEDGTICYDGLELLIDEKIQIEQKLKVAKEKAEESNRMKTAFLQNMSHEIRTPMNAINGFSQMLVNPELSANKRNKFVNIILNSSKQLLSIVTDILTISSLETKQENVMYEKVCLNDIIDDLQTIYSDEAQTKKIFIYTKNGLNDQNATIYTDKTKVTQVLTNLINNALKFTQEGFIEVGYDLIKKAESKEILFFVKDSGIGIEPKLQEKIFERFQQTDTKIDIKHGGTGLGLSISKGFVELLGGTIWVRSKPGEGATFYFTIPYKLDEE